jgi:hypothetical protein
MLESELARNTKQVAISLGCPGLPIGVLPNEPRSSVVIVEITSGVHTYVPPSEPTTLLVSRRSRRRGDSPVLGQRS